MELTADVVAAGARAFGRHGYRDATLQLIAEEAGLSRVTLHRRGVTKRAVLDALALGATEDYQRALWPALTAEGSGRERLEAGLSALCRMAEDNMSLLLALRSESDGVFHESGDDGNPVMTRSVFTEPLERLLRDGAADGTLRELDPARSATVLFNLVGWTYVHLREGHRWPPDDARAAVIDIALRGVLGQAVRAR